MKSGVCQLALVGFVVTAGAVLTGCRQGRPIPPPFASTLAEFAEPLARPAARLASHSDPPAAGQTAEPSPPPKPSAERKPDDPAQGTLAPAAASVAYTAPGLAFQQLSIAATATVVAAAEAPGGAGREVSESLVRGAQGVSGRAGLAAAATAADGSILSSSGLGEGQLGRLGFAASQNIFGTQVNRLSGPAGRCSELAGAGFFGGSRLQCEVSFRPQR